MAKNNTRNRAPATTPEAREKQVVARAYDLAEQQIMEGTASSQVITHFLKIGSSRERYEKEKLQNENKLMQAKVADLENRKTDAVMIEKALEAMKSYSGNG